MGLDFKDPNNFFLMKIVLAVEVVDIAGTCSSFKFANPAIT
jgi:hypothetical protein